MAGLATTLSALSALAFGAVYPWGYFPLFGAAAIIGIVGVARGRTARTGGRQLLVALLLLEAAIALQLLPLPRRALEAVSPRSSQLLRQYDLAFTDDSLHPLSIAPADTGIALAGLSALVLYAWGASAMI